MNSKKFLNFILILFILFFWSCNKQDWEKIKFQKGEIFYNKTVKKDIVTKLGTYFVENKLFDNKTKKSVRLENKNNKYTIKMIIKKSYWNNKDFEEKMEFVGQYLAVTIFNSQHLDIIFTDKNFKTQKTIPIKYIYQLTSGSLSFFYTDNIKQEIVEKLANYLKSGITTKTSIQVDMKNNVYILKMIVLDSLINKSNITQIFTDMGKDISKAVLNKNPLTIHLTNKYFQIKKTIQIK